MAMDGQSATSEAGRFLFRAANVWWRCAHYFVIASFGKMPPSSSSSPSCCECVCCI